MPRTLAFSAALLLAPAAAQANILRNNSFKTTVAVQGGTSGFPVPAPRGISYYERAVGFAPWGVSAYKSFRGFDRNDCAPAFGFGCTGKENWVATVEDAWPEGVLPTPVTMCQTIDMQASAKRLAGDFATSTFAVAVSDEAT